MGDVVHSFWENMLVAGVSIKLQSKKLFIFLKVLNVSFSRWSGMCTKIKKLKIVPTQPKFQGQINLLEGPGAQMLLLLPINHPIPPLSVHSVQFLYWCTTWPEHCCMVLYESSK